MNSRNAPSKVPLGGEADSVRFLPFAQDDSFETVADGRDERKLRGQQLEAFSVTDKP